MKKGKSLGLEEARMIVNAAIKHAESTVCTGFEGRPMAVAVADRHGDLLYFERMDWEGPERLISRMCVTKARTALEIWRDTIDWGESLRKHSVKLYDFASTELTTIPSGCLIKTKDGSVVGAIGTSGRAPLGPGGDEDVARAGIKAFEESEYF